MSKKLYVGNLLYEVTDDQLRDFFSQAGNVVTATVIRFADSGRSKGFGFVEMSTEEEAQAAIEMFDQKEMEGRKLIVNEARPPKPRDERGGGGPRRGGFNNNRGGGYNRGGGSYRDGGNSYRDSGYNNRGGNDYNRRGNDNNSGMGDDFDLGLE